MNRGTVTLLAALAVHALPLQALEAQHPVVVHLTSQDRHLSRVVPISTDAGKTWKPVWAGVKNGRVSNSTHTAILGTDYNFFCVEVRKPAIYGQPGTFAASDGLPWVSARSESMIWAVFSHAHDLGQVNADAAAAMQLLLWEIVEDDGDIGLSSGKFRARPTNVVRSWFNTFTKLTRSEVPGTVLVGFSNPVAQNMLALGYSAPNVGVPVVPQVPYGGDGTSIWPSYDPNHVPSPGTLALVVAGLFAISFFRRRK